MRGTPGPKWTVQVKVPPDKAYGYVSDLSRHAEWGDQADEMKIEAEQPGPPKVGGKYKAVGKLVGKVNPSTVTITALEPPRRIEFEAEDSSGISGHVFTFGPQDGGTLITRQMFGVKRPWYGPILFLVFKGAIDKNYNSALANLKSNLEKGT